MNKTKKKFPTRYPRVYRVAFVNEAGKVIHEPLNKFESYRYVIEAGKRKMQWGRFAEQADAVKHAGLEVEDVTPVVQPQGLTFRRLLAEFFWIYRRNVGRAALHKMQDSSKHWKSLHGDLMEAIDVARIDRLIAHWKSSSYLEGQKSTRVTYFDELRRLRVVLKYYQSRKNNKYFVPLLPEHWENLEVRPNVERYRKDLLKDEFDRFHAVLVSRFGQTRPEIAHLAKLQYLIGGRIQEAAAVHYEDIDVQAGTITLRRSIEFDKRKGQRRRLHDELKTENQRVIPSRKAAQHAMEWCLRNGIRSGPIYLHQGELLKYKAIGYRYSKAFIQAGLKQRATHVLRHAAITEFKETCGDIYLTKEFAGHRSVTTTERYAKNRSETLRRALDLRDEKLETKILANFGQSGG